METPGAGQGRDVGPVGNRLGALARAVRRRRQDLGLNQSGLADLAGCSQRFVHTLEYAKPSLQMDKVLDVLEVLGLGLEVVPGQGEVHDRHEEAGHAP